MSLYLGLWDKSIMIQKKKSGGFIRFSHQECRGLWWSFYSWCISRELHAYSNWKVVDESDNQWGLVYLQMTRTVLFTYMETENYGERNIINNHIFKADGSLTMHRDWPSGIIYSCTNLFQFWVSASEAANSSQEVSVRPVHENSRTSTKWRFFRRRGRNRNNPHSFRKTLNFSHIEIIFTPIQGFTTPKPVWSSLFICYFYSCQSHQKH